jgi:predicted O-methyltransferase YrrM
VERASGLLLACADYWLRRGLRRQYGGPFNDQRARARLCAQVAGSGEIRAVVETGTYRGTTTLFMARTFGRRVYSVEIAPRYHYYARLRTRGAANIRLSLGSSPDFLRRLSEDPVVPKEDVFFYLDAHRAGEVPLREELDVVSRGWEQPVIMIDDFEVPGDPGYGFNEDEPGPRFDMQLLSPFSAHFQVFHPATPSTEETGYRRGCAILVKPGRWAERLRHLPLLREHARG